MSRQDASDLLMSEKEGGVFLVRDSTSIHGDFVLCVREDSKVSHYIINKIQQGEHVRYRIGDQMFPDIPSLLAFYKLHYLDTTPLIRPALKKTQRVIAKYDFEGNDPDDLPFRKGTINFLESFRFLIVISSSFNETIVIIQVKYSRWCRRTRSNGGRPEIVSDRSARCRCRTFKSTTRTTT